MTTTPRHAIASMMIALALCGSALLAPAQAVTPIERAEEVVQWLEDGKYETFHESCDDRMRSALPADKLKQIWEGLQTQLGPYKQTNGAVAETVGTLQQITIPCSFGSTNFKMQITLDSQDRVSGFFVRPDTSRTEYNPPVYVKPDRFREEEVTVSPGAFPLPGTLTIPNDASADHRLPAVVLIHGSGPHDQDETVQQNKPFRDLAWGLASKGIIVCRYEKRTHKHPTFAKPEDITLENEVIDDAVAAVQLLAERPEADPNRLFVLGHSLGGMAAPFVGQRYEGLAGIILFAAPARPLTDLIEEQVHYIAKSDGEVSDAEREQNDEMARAIAAIREGKSDGPAVLGMPPQYLIDMNRHDPVSTAKSLTIPMFVAQGGRDYQVTMKDYERWRGALGDRDNVTFRVFDACNHLFIEGTGPSTPQEYASPGHVAADVVDALADWLKQTR